MSREIVCNAFQVSDLCLCLLSGLLAGWLHSLIIVSDSNYRLYVYPVGLGGAALSFVLFKSGVYTFPNLRNLVLQLRQLTIALSAMIAVLTIIAYLTKVAELYSRSWALTWFCVTFGVLASTRLLLYYCVRRWVRQGFFTRAVAILGTGPAAQQLVSKLRRASDGEISIVGIFDDRKARAPDHVCGFPVLGTSDDLITLARDVLVDEIIIALPVHAQRRIGDLATKLRSVPVDLRLTIDWIESFPVRRLGTTATARTIELYDRPLKNWSRVAKWLEDKIFGVGLLITLAPLMAMIALAIRLETPGPILFVQHRFGFNNKLIPVLKFRTMYAPLCDQSGAMHTTRYDPRVTRVGRILRALSLDELPQLINVLRGEMSLVGPRPHVPGMKAGDRLYYEAVNGYFSRHHVRPGLTGWAQVNNLRGEISSLEAARERVAHDLYYIENWTLGFDIRVLFKTVAVALKGQNAY